MTLDQIERNDLKAAAAYYKERGTISGEEWMILWRLQDSPAELEELARRRNWKIVQTPSLVEELLGKM